MHTHTYNIFITHSWYKKTKLIYTHVQDIYEGALSFSVLYTSNAEW